MVYRKRNYRRRYRRRRYRKRYPRRPRQTKAQRYANMAVSAYKMGKTAMSLLNTELKYRDTEAGPIGLSPTTAQFSINTIPQGDRDVDRDGNKVRLKSIQTNIQIKKHASATTDKVRILLVRVPIMSSDIDPKSQLYESNSFISLRDMNNTKKYEIIWSTTCSLNADYPEKIFNIYKKFDLPLNYTGATATDIETNNFYLVYKSINSSNQATLYFKSRMRFIDN